MKSFIISTVAALAGLALAQVGPITQLDGGQLAIHKPNLNEQVPVGEPYTITWSNDYCLDSTLTILFLRGSPSNMVRQGVIVTGTENDGSYEGWVPDVSLPDSTQGYGLQLVCDLTGEYQWSTQFGFLNPGGNPDRQMNTTTPVTQITTEPDTPTSLPAMSGNMTISATEFPTSSVNMSHPTTTKDAHSTQNATKTTTKKPTAKPTKDESSVVESSGPTKSPDATTKSPSPTPTAGVDRIAASSGLALIVLVVVGFTLF